MMYINKDKGDGIIKDLTANMVSELKGKSEFLLALYKDDDWSMIIKSHALIESIVTDLILTKTEEPKLRSIIERLPISDEQIGKVKIAKDYGILSTEERYFIKNLSELRNNLVHKFENINFNLSDHVESLDKNQKKSWQRVCTWYEDGKDVENSWFDNSLSKPKVSLWIAIYMFVSLTTVNITELQGYAKINDESKRTMNDLLKKYV